MNQNIIDRMENNVDYVPDLVEGMFDIPVIYPEQYKPAEFIPFNLASSVREAKGMGIHFFIHDYLFQRLWYFRNKYAGMLQRFDAVMSPDFSTYTDFPLMVSMFNHYRKHLIGAWMQSIGIRVYPTISWADKDSFQWCFDGEPHHATVCISSVGTQKHKDTKRLFMQGYDRMLEVLEPETILFYGEVPKECQGNIVQMKSFCKEIKERSKGND